MLARKWPASISGRGGHNTTFALACDLARRGLEVDAIFQILLNHYNRRCKPEWTEAELRHKAEDAHFLVLAEGEATHERTEQSPALDSK